MTEFHAGDLIGDYRLEARLGHGGFGTVWRARHLNTGRLVAVKVLPENENLQDSATLRADVELLAASAASASPHIVQVIGGGTDPVPHVVMEFINGSSLAEELKTRGKLSQQEVIEIGLGISAALEALQAAGIVHRDVKPSNVLIDRGGTVKLTDFGIAKIAGYDAVTVTGQLPLSISYAAPEVWEGKAEHRSDLYALGVLLYQCLCGSLPFRGAYAELFYQHRSSLPDLTALPTSTAPSLLDLISVCLRKDPGERPEGAATCKALLIRAKEETQVATEEAEPLVEPAKFGAWVKGEPHPQQPWAWVCSNPETGQEAIIELHFAANAAYGERLRKAVVESPNLTPFGAEHLLQTNRLILRPGEAWTEPPPGQFQFWVAREEIGLPEAPTLIGASELLGYTESLQALIEASSASEVPLHLNSETLHPLPDGSVHLRRPGLDVDYEGDSGRDALEYLKSKQLTREVRPLVARATSLEDLRVSLERLQAIGRASAASAGTAGRKGGRLRLVGAGLVLAAVVAVAAVSGVFLLQGDNNKPEENAVISSPTVAPPPVAAACLALTLPATLDVAQTTCTQGATLRFDDSCRAGTACKRETIDGIVTVGMNDRTVAYIDDTGKLSVGRENGLNLVPLSRGDNVVSSAWSPDGAYLAYLTTQTIDATTTTEAGISTQLRIVEPGRAANDGLVLATNNLKDRTPTGLQRLISSPQWSPDGKLIYFLWSLPNAQGGEVFAVEVPRNALGDIDFAKLRSGSLADETRVDFPMTTFSLAAADFGVSTGYIGGLRVGHDGELLLQVCQGTTAANRSCGIGRWIGTAELLLKPEAGVVYGLPVASPFDGALHAARLEAGEWSLVRIEAGAAVPVPAVTFPEAIPAVTPVFAFNRKGDALLLETTAGQLSLVGYGTGIATPWGPGLAPRWFVAKAGAPRPPVATPPASVYSTPSATATPSPTATPAPPLQMTILLTVRRNGINVSGARVVATVNSVECATVITTGSATTMNFPSPSSPAACRQSGATIRFIVDGTQFAAPTTTYMPQSSQNFDLNFP